MKRRIAFIIISSVFAISLLMAAAFNQIPASLPAAGQQVLDAYLQSDFGDQPETTFMYAPYRELFTAESAHQIAPTTDSDYRASPVLYDGEIIRPPESTNQYPFPAQEVWCVTLTRSNQTAEHLILARHDNLYEENWILYQSDTGSKTQETIGCDSQ